MSLIQPQPKAAAKEQFTVRLEREVAENLRRYCQFIQSTQDYVLNQALKFTFEKDKAFQTWLVSNPRSESETADRERPVGRKARPE